MAERYSTQKLLGILTEINRPKRYLLETFFPSEQTFETEEVYFNKLLTSRRLAPFVSPLVKGKPMPRTGESLVSFKPPYLKPKHVLTPSTALKTLPGESFDGEMSLQARIDRIRAQDLRDQDDIITRREEWMASMLLRTGALTIEAEDHPTMVINLGRPSGHTVALTSTARWGETDVSPYENLRTWAGTVADVAGVAPTRVIMEPKAASLLMKDAFIAKMMGQFKGPPRDFDVIGKIAIPDEVQYLGSFGEFEFYQYQSTYLNADGSVGKIMPDYTVIMGSPSGVEGVRAYGAILDFERLAAISRFPKEWTEPDPSAHFIMTQSAPLPLMGRPEATFCATVR